MLNNFFKKPDFKSTGLKASIKMTLIDDDEMALSEHIEEFSQRLVFCLIFLILATLVCFADVKEAADLEKKMSTLSLGSNNNNHNNGDGGGDEVFEDNSVHKQNIENLARGKPLRSITVIITNCDD